MRKNVFKKLKKKDNTEMSFLVCKQAALKGITLSFDLYHRKNM